MALRQRYNLPPPPLPDADFGDYSWKDWFRNLRDYVIAVGTIEWSQINFLGSNLADIQTRPHNVLQSIQGGSSLLGEFYHLNNVQHTDLTDGGDTTLHYHASDRNLANATGVLGIANGGTGRSTAGASGSFTTADSKTVTVVNGIITSIV